MKSAPIILFAYNRPEHTFRVLEALASNELAGTSSLSVFCDGPRNDADSEEIRAIRQVRQIVSSRNWCGTTNVYHQPHNLGLARSIRGGVEQILATSDRVIVLEDDIVTSPGFLRYMNDGLAAYDADETVMHISGYLPRTTYQSMLPETFLSTHMSCWGWGTWKSSWEKARWGAAELLAELDQSSGGRVRFDFDGTADFSSQLVRNMDGTLRTWAIFWAASIYLSGGLCLLPGRSLVRNIGTDGSGENFMSDESAWYDVDMASSIRVEQISRLSESAVGRFYLKSFFRYGPNSGIRKRVLRVMKRIRERAGATKRAARDRVEPR